MSAPKDLPKGNVGSLGITFRVGKADPKGKAVSPAGPLGAGSSATAGSSGMVGGSSAPASKPGVKFALPPAGDHHGVTFKVAPASRTATQPQLPVGPTPTASVVPTARPKTQQQGAVFKVMPAARLLPDLTSTSPLSTAFPTPNIPRRDQVSSSTSNTAHSFLSEPHPVRPSTTSPHDPPLAPTSDERKAWKVREHRAITYTAECLHRHLANLEWIETRLQSYQSNTIRLQNMAQTNLDAISQAISLKRRLEDLNEPSGPSGMQVDD